MIVDCAIYRDGHRIADVDDIRVAVEHAKQEGDEFVWIGLYEPTEEELEEVAAEFDLHPLAVEDAVHAHQRPKIERYGDSVFVVLKTLGYDEARSALSVGEIMLFVGHGFVVTVRHGEANPLSDVRHRLETDEQQLLAHGPPAVLYAVADAVVDRYVVIADLIEEDLNELEDRVFSPKRTNDAEMIYKLKREVLEFRRAVIPLGEPLRWAANGGLPGLAADTLPFFRDVADHAARVADQIDQQDNLLTDILHANLAQVGVRQNEDMRRISAWIAIAAVPTMIAGVYGMNFDHMPELRWRWGYYLVLALMAGVCSWMYRAFKRSGWL
ncbi:MAG: magnesium/cobalt transporter CorA [Sporichthyaceae bacterium]|nr:magnesium/cobalt transporter CorA [Sporichthyaceae bacterium]